MTKAKNSYVVLSDFLQWVTPQDTSADTNDDAAIETILEAVSRYIDAQTNRTFYPRIETRYFDTPPGREILLDDDLLEVISITNADGTALTSSDYNLIPKNTSPRYAVRITKGSLYYWHTNTTDVDEFSVDIAAYWGYRERYSADGWKSVGALEDAIVDTTTLAFTMEAGYTAAAGKIVKIDNEIFVIETISEDTAGVATVTPKARGDNGSTAATHLDEAVVYEWQPQEEVVLACKMIAQNVWRRFGVSQADENIVTASGVVITPRDVPTLAATALGRLRKRL